VESAQEALIRTWPLLRTWIDTNREKLRSRAAILQAKADWEKSDRRDDMLLPAGLQLERARSLLADPGDITTDDIKEFVSLSSARVQAEEKQKEADAARARQQRIIRWALAAVGVVILIAGATVGYLQWDKARQLARQELALAHAQANILGELSGTKLLRGEMDSALRLASRGTRIDLALPNDKARASPAAAALAAAVSQVNWRFALGGHNDVVSWAAF